jgi:hypothetical protein
MVSDQHGAGCASGGCFSPDGKWVAVHVFDWATDVPGIDNPKKERIGVPGYNKDRIEILSLDGSERRVVPLENVTKVYWLSHPEWR